MIQYSFPLLSGGYRWNFLQRIYHTLGMYPTGISDVGGQTIVSFGEALSSEQEATLNTLVADNPNYPPTPTGTVFHVEDLWEKFHQFCLNAGVDLKLYYCETVPGSGNIDRIELQAATMLSEEQINQVKAAYANLITHG